MEDKKRRLMEIINEMKQIGVTPITIEKKISDLENELQKYLREKVRTA